MKQIIKTFLTVNFYSLSLFFVFIGSAFLSIPPRIPSEYLLSLGRMVFPSLELDSIVIFLNIVNSLGFEFYGGAIMSFAFGIVDEKEKHYIQTDEARRHNELVARINFICDEINCLSSQVDKIEFRSNKRSNRYYKRCRNI